MEELKFSPYLLPDLDLLSRLVTAYSVASLLKQENAI